MYAIVKTGGKQYRVQPSGQVKVEKIPGDPGTKVDLDNVLALSAGDGIELGTPLVEGALVKATILRSAKDRKVIVFKKKRRKGYHKKQGHRQWYTLLRIDEIIHGSTVLKAATEEPPTEAPLEEAVVAPVESEAAAPEESPADTASEETPEEEPAEDRKPGEES